MMTQAFATTDPLLEIAERRLLVPFDLESAALARVFGLLGAHRIDDAGLAAHATVFAERLRDYPAWPELAELVPCEIREVPLTDRPSDDA